MGYRQSVPTDIPTMYHKHTHTHTRATGTHNIKHTHIHIHITQKYATHSFSLDYGRNNSISFCANKKKSCGVRVSARACARETLCVPARECERVCVCSASRLVGPKLFAVAPPNQRNGRTGVVEGRVEGRRAREGDPELDCVSKHGHGSGHCEHRRVFLFMCKTIICIYSCIQ